MSEQDRDQAVLAAVHARLLKRAATDPEFRRLLLDNPKSALARELGIDVPDHVHVTVLPETRDHLFIVIPPLGGDDPAGVGAARFTETHDAYGAKILAGAGTSYGGRPLTGSDTTYGGRLVTGIEALARQGVTYGGDTEKDIPLRADDVRSGALPTGLEKLAIGIDRYR
jgi:hypothetical protein